METITNKLLAVLLLFTFSTFGQSMYVASSFDANKAFGLRDNPRTVVDHRGLDWNLEAGIIDGNIGGYLSYGRFDNAGFKNYKVGADYYVRPWKWLDMSIGAGIGQMKKRFRTGQYFERISYEGVGWYHFRAITTFKYKGFGFGLKTQFQDRSDVTDGYVLEGQIIFKYEFEL